MGGPTVYRGPLGGNKPSERALVSYPPPEREYNYPDLRPFLFLFQQGYMFATSVFASSVDITLLLSLVYVQLNLANLYRWLKHPNCPCESHYKS